MRKHTLGFAALAALVLLYHPTLAQDLVSTSFQNGVAGYSGTVDQRISSGGDETAGADSADYFLDGFSTSGNGSPDTQGLLRFDDILGNGEGQIPEGATILDARLTLNTSLAGNAQTGGPYGVAGLLGPFDEFTTYNDFEASEDVGLLSRGAWWQDGSATRPLAGFGFQVPGVPDTARVTPIVQAWADGSLDNNGLVIQAGRNDIEADTANTSDGWSIRTTGFPIANTRPKLEVDYTTAAVQISSFQEGSNDYAGTTMAIVRSGLNALIEDADDLLTPEFTEDTFDLDQTFLDGVRFADVEGNTNSTDDFALLKFDDVFGSDPGQVPSGVPVAKAWAVLTTGDINNNAHSSGPWSAHSMLRPWDFESLHSSFGDTNGLQVVDDDIRAELDALDGFIRGSEVWFDVTDHLEGVRSGAEDFGIAVLTKRTADGWMIHTPGSEDDLARPRLVVYSADLAIDDQIALDCSGDGVVDAGDLSCVHLAVDPIADRDLVLATIPSLAGDLDGDGEVVFADFLILSGNFGFDNDTAPAYTDGNIDMADGVNFGDFLVLAENFGQVASNSAAAVPEPSASWLIAIGSLVLGRFRPRR